MQVVHARCCGLDVHKQTVVACVLLTAAPTGRCERQVRTFGTMTADLLALSDWLAQLGVTQVALESTGVYWRPVFNLLEDGRRAVVLVNPQHIKRVPGRKTDVKDAEWLADLLRHGLLRASFIPPAPIRGPARADPLPQDAGPGARATRSTGCRRCWRAANIKLAAVATDVLGVERAARCWRPCWAARQDPTALAELAAGPAAGQAAGAAPGAGRAGPAPPPGAARRSSWPTSTSWRSRIAQLQRGDRARPGPVRGEAVALLQTHPRRRARTAAAAIVAEIGDRHGPLPLGQAPGLLGRGVPRQHAERRQAR